MKDLTVQESFNQRQANRSITFMDVRTPAEYGSAHAEGAINHPMESLDLNNLPFLKSEEVHVICQSGGRSMKVCQKLAAAGYEKVVNVEGGTAAWLDANLPTVTGKKAMSLERQVRIAAGSLVLIGAALGHFVTPGWYLQELPIPAEWGFLLLGCPGTGRKEITKPQLDPLVLRSFFAVLIGARPLLS